MIDLTRTSAEAVKDLKHYLDFAARGPVALGEAIRAVGTSNYDSDFELAVAERLRRSGWTVRTQIGVSKYRIDLGVVHPDAPGRFLAGIECDGATYHSSPSARDRDRVRHIILEHLGWRLFRLWSTDFFNDEEGSLAALDAQLRDLLEADRKDAVEVDHTQLPAAETWNGTVAETANLSDEGKSDLGGFLDEGRFEAIGGTESGGPIQCSPPAENRPAAAERIARAPQPPAPAAGDNCLPAPDPTRFYEPSYLPRIEAIAAAIIDAEGPITFKRLTDRIARAHGFQRTGKQISSTVWAACRKLRAHVATPDGHKVFWAEGSRPEALVPFRGLCIAGERREWREVPQPEKLWLVRELRQTNGDDTARAVAETIGVGRITAQFRTEIADLVRHLARG
jgi:very-short-patch-repair endonuclease